MAPMFLMEIVIGWATPFLLPYYVAWTLQFLFVSLVFPEVAPLACKTSLCGPIPSKFGTFTPHKLHGKWF